VIPGLLQVDTQGGLHAGWVQARSEGSWSDQLQVNATILESPLPPGAVLRTGSEPQVVGTVKGDVVQLYFPDSQTLAYHTLSDARWFWFQDATAGPVAKPDSVLLLGPGSETPVPFVGLDANAGELVLHLTRDAALGVPPGSWLRLQSGSNVLLFLVEAMEAGSSAAASPGAPEPASLTSRLVWQVMDPAAAWNAKRNATVQASVVTFELRARPQGATEQRISDLGLVPDHPRFWGLLPTDAALYAPVDRPAPVPYAALATEIDHPRYPLAAPATIGLGLPLGMPGLVRADFAQGASMPGATALERDGLTSFDIDLFIDPRLRTSEAGTLVQDAFFIQYQANVPSPPEGLYSLLSVDEASLVAVPDAAHTGWRTAPAQIKPLSAPDPVQVSPPDAAGNYTVSWGAVPTASGYRVQQAADPLFETAVTSRDAGANQSLNFTNDPQCPLKLYYRVSAYGVAGSSPFSVTVSVELGAGSFSECNAHPLAAPALQLFEERNRLILTWTAPNGAAAGVFTLETADDPEFAAGFTLFQGDDSRFEYWKVPGPPAYFRVNVQRNGEASPWSNTVSTVAEPVTPFEMIPDAEAGPPVVQLEIHRAMLRMASARKDMVAIMSLPISYRRDEATAYRQTLAANIALEDNTGRMLSYGALYHPWVVVRDNSGPLPLSLRTGPPDGGVSGVIAAKALAAGAWIAPANVALNSAVSLVPTLQDYAPQAFAANRINLIAQQPDGFFVTDQNTLMADPEFRPLNVRRLLILLRRLALREGVRFVFQNITPALERAVMRQFESWMNELLARGAFAGLAAQDSFRVVADATVNPPQAIDEGRFVVELRVAPSRPMRFLTVRLVQTGGNLTLEEA
jgi:hypothetical protein